MVQSFSAKGHPYDNAVMECFFKYLKKEETDRKSYSSFQELSLSLFEYINGQPIKFCVNNNPSSNKRILDCGAIRLSDLPRVNSSFLSAECYARRA